MTGEELRLRIYAKHPHIIKEYDFFECGSGWFGLIEDMFDAFAKLELEEYAPIGQIKEKFGGLRVYLDGCSSKMETVIFKFESLSYEVCINCGSIEDVEMVGAWIRPLCSMCRSRT
jgi:hypothetical protein